MVLDANDKPVKTLQWKVSDADKWKFGRYTARMVLAYDDGRKDVPLEATVSFWVIPLRVIGIGLLIGLLVGVGLWSTIRKIVRKIPKSKSKMS